MMRSLQRTVLVLTLVFLASGVAQAAPRVRDVWHSYVADGKRYGYIHTVVARLPDGNFRITRESRRADRPPGGQQGGDHRARGISWWRRIIGRYRSPSRGSKSRARSRVTGRSRGTSFEVTATVAGVERSWVFDRPEAILPEPCLDDWLADRPPGFRGGRGHAAG